LGKPKQEKLLRKLLEINEKTRDKLHTVPATLPGNDLYIVFTILN
jgi:hypothetical protein